MPPVRLSKAVSRPSEVPVAPGVQQLTASRIRLRDIRELTDGGVGVIGGTTGSLLKMAEKLDRLAAYGRQPGGFKVRLLLVDESSMMVFPAFLALATLVADDGEIMQTGDHRQLAPIMAHDSGAGRPASGRPLHEPYASAYDAVRSIALSGRLPPHGAVLLSALQYSFRLPAVIRGAVAKLYRRDRIELQGSRRSRGRLATRPALSGSACGRTPADSSWCCTRSVARRTRTAPKPR